MAGTELDPVVLERGAGLVVDGGEDRGTVDEGDSWDCLVGDGQIPGRDCSVERRKSGLGSRGVRMKSPGTVKGDPWTNSAEELFFCKGALFRGKGGARGGGLLDHLYAPRHPPSAPPTGEHQGVNS